MILYFLSYHDFLLSTLPDKSFQYSILVMKNAVKTIFGGFYSHYITYILSTVTACFHLITTCGTKQDLKFWGYTF